MFNVNETVAWAHIDEETGQRVNELVRVMRVPNPDAELRSARIQYQVMVLRTGEPALAFADEMMRVDVEGLI